MIKDSFSGRAAFLCSVEAFIAGLLFILSILLMILESPSDFVGVLTCLDSWDHVPIRSWPLFKARHVLRTLHQPDFSPIFR